MSRHLFRPHRWVFVDSRRMTYVKGGGELTTVLYRCDRCEKVRTDDLDGHWTREQITKDVAR
jgi:hypothetical protein